MAFAYYITMLLYFVTGPAVSLFQKSYFELMQQALRPGGIVCSQAGTVWASLEHVCDTFKHCQQVFPKTVYAYTSVPTYPTGQIGFVMGSLHLVRKYFIILIYLNNSTIHLVILRFIKFYLLET